MLDSPVVHELGGDQDGGDEEAMDGIRVDANHRRGLLSAAALLIVGIPSPREAVEVDVGDDEAGGAAPGVPVYPLHVPPHGDPRERAAPEHHHLRRRRRGSSALGVAALRRALQQPRQDGHHPWRGRGFIPAAPRRRRRWLHGARGRGKGGSGCFWCSRRRDERVPAAGDGE